MTAREREMAARRRAAILTDLGLHGSVRVQEIADRFGVSLVTARRDVVALARQGRLQRVHGGGVLVPTEADDGTRHGVIGVVIPSGHGYFQEILAGARQGAREAGVRLILATSYYDEAEESRIVDRLRRARVDALLIATARPTDQRLPSWFATLDRPVVLVERQCAARGVDYVRSEHEAGVEVALDHLAQEGHERVALAVLSSTPTSVRLIAGFETALAARSGMHAPFPPVTFVWEDQDLSQRNAALESLLDSCAATGTTAVIVHSDDDAVALLGLALERGLRIPQDLSIVAYDDVLAALGSVPLTAVAPPKYDVGRLAVSVAARRVTAGDRAATQRVRLVPRLVRRRSTAPPGTPPPGTTRTAPHDAGDRS
ncbi:substrate-binding domain-containing protein [Promicromonospora sp. CA-289599]|uniref:LacI family DNA-binding transcriptional regulator n=1 Tax=Promicromonospora sp. CA-289599 TaxID=3240014 RepID=UPI003D924B40